MSHKITKKSIISNLRLKKGYSLNYSKKIIEDLIEQIIQNIGLGNLILKNLGSFKLLKKAERLGRNPKNGKIYKISARKTVKFILSANINKRINKL